MKSRYSAFTLFKEGLRNHQGWEPAWRDASPKSSYDVVIIGGGGQGLATAYYLAKNHGITNVAVLEKGWIGGGNTGRNTTIVRSNYFFPESAAFYDFSLKLYEGLSKELNYNIMLSQRGLMVLSHNHHQVEINRRSANAMMLNGVDVELLDEAEVRRRVPILNDSPRFPIVGGLYQPRAGTARHDAVAWGYARAASALGVDIIQNCEVTGFEMNDKGRVVGVHTSRGDIKTDQVGVAVAGNTSVIAKMAGLKLPMRSYGYQAFVSEPVKPMLDTSVVSPMTGAFANQSDKGELVMGGPFEPYCSYAQRGNLPVMEHSTSGIVEMFPAASRMRVLRQWSGLIDIMHDMTPVISRSPVEGLYLNCGWSTGGFKAIPAGGHCFAHTIAKDAPHPLVEPFNLKRFETGALIDEAGASGVAH